jgi:hypothetical protein
LDKASWDNEGIIVDGSGCDNRYRIKQIKQVVLKIQDPRSKDMISPNAPVPSTMTHRTITGSVIVL